MEKGKSRLQSYEVRSLQRFGEDLARKLNALRAAPDRKKLDDLEELVRLYRNEVLRSAEPWSFVANDVEEVDERRDLDRRWQIKEIDGWQWFRSRLAIDWKRAHWFSVDRKLEEAAELPRREKQAQAALDQLGDLQVADAPAVRQSFENLRTDEKRSQVKAHSALWVSRLMRR